MTKEKIRTELKKQICGNSCRDIEACKIIEQNIKIDKKGYWYNVTLFDQTVNIYCNAKYCYNQIFALLRNNRVWKQAKSNVKQYFLNNK